MADEQRPTTASDVETELSRDIGFWGAVALGVGTMIAAGIFVLSGLAVSNVGTMAIVSFLIAALVASFTAFAYAEFAAIYPESGGGYMYVANTYDSDLTYIVGWSMILGYPASAAFYMASFSDWFFRFMYPAMDIPTAIPYWVSGLGVLVLLVGINLKGTEETGAFQVVVTALKVGLIGLFLYGGLQAFDASAIQGSLQEHLTSFRQIGLTSALVFITFFGFEAIATNAEEIKSPGKTVPRAIFFSMGFVTIVYTLVVLVIVIAVNDVGFLGFLADQAGLPGLEEARTFVGQNGEISMGRAAQYYLGDFGFYVIIVGALASMVSAANATVMAGSRVKLAMSRRDHLPRAFEDLHDRFNTPYKAVLLTGGLILFFIIFFSVWFGEVPGAVGEAHVPFGLHLGVEALAHFADFMLLVGLIFVNLAIIKSRNKYPDVERPFKVPGVPVVPIIAVLANLALLVNVDPTSFVLGLVAQFAGIGFWAYWKTRPPSVEQLEEETPTALAERRAPGGGYTVLVAVANPEHADQLMETAIPLARAHDGEVLVTSVVTLPEQTPLEEGHKYTAERRGVLETAMAKAEAAGVPVSGVIRIGHHAADAITNTAEQYEADAVLIGWHGRPSRKRDVVLGTTVDKVATHTPGSILVERMGETPAGEASSILVATAGGEHAKLAVRLAADLATVQGASIHLVNVVRADAPEDEREEAQAILDEARAELPEDLEVETELLEGYDVADTLVEATGRHDLTIIGATREGILQQLVFGAIPEDVGERARSTVIMAKHNKEAASRLKRFFRWR